MSKDKSKGSPKTTPSKPPKGGKVLVLGESTHPTNRKGNYIIVDTTGSTGPKSPAKKK